MITLPASVLARRREVALILRRASEAGRFDREAPPRWPMAKPSDWAKLVDTARELLGKEYEDVALDAWTRMTDVLSRREEVYWRVEGQSEEDLLGPRGQRGDYR